MANSANVGNSHIFMIGLVVSCWLLNLFLFLISDDKCHQILAQIPYSKPLYEDFMTKRSPQP